MGSDEILQEILAALNKAADNGIAFGPEISNYLDKYSKGLLRGAKDLASINKEIDKYSKKLGDGTKKAKDLEWAITSLKNTIDDLDDGYEKSMAKDRLRTLEKQKNHKQAMEDLTKSAADFGKSLASQPLAAIKSTVTGLTSNASGFKIAGDAIVAGAEVVGNGFTTIGQSATAAGTAMLTSLIPQLRVAGAVVTTVGTGIAMFGEGLKKVTQFVVPLLIQEADKLQKSYEEATTAGVLFADGMVEFRQHATNAGLTQEQLTNIVKRSSQLFAQSGYTVTNFIKSIDDVTDAMTEGGENSLQNQLLRLGYGFEEIVDMQAQVMADQAKFGIAFNKSNVAQATSDYAKNLRVIADITGEDAKKKMDEARKEAEQYAVRAKIAEIAAKTGKDAGQLMREFEFDISKMSPLGKRAYTQMVAFGTTTEAAAYMMPGLVQSLQQSRDAFVNFGESGMESYLKFAEANKGTFNETIRAISIANMATGAYGDMTNYLNEESLNQIKFNQKNNERARYHANDTATTTNAMTNEFVTIAKTAQEMRVGMQEILTNNLLPNFAESVKTALEIMKTAINKFGGRAKEDTGGTGFEDTGYQSDAGGKTKPDGTPSNPVSVVITGEAPAGGSTFSPGLTPKPDRISSAALRHYAQLSYDERPPEPIRLPGFPGERYRPPPVILNPEQLGPNRVLGDGGITQGISIAGEKGPEAVVPLPNGRSIPVDLDLGPLVVALQDLLDVNKDNRDYLEKLFHASV